MRKFSKERGSSLLEYILLVSFLIAVAMIAVRVTGEKVAGSMSTVAREMATCAGTEGGDGGGRCGMPHQEGL